MDFGIFMPNSRNGYIMSEASPQYTPSHALMSDIVRAGEANGFGFALTMSSLRGHGGSTRFWDDSLESMTTMAALAKDTTSMQLIGSVQLLAVHPALAARAAVTIDDISGGRFALNLVPGGWHPRELESLGVWPGPEYNGYRWRYATEYAQVLWELWTEGVSNFSGEHFAFDDLRLGPLPERPIPIVAAGASESAIEFCAEYAEYNFRLAWGGMEALRTVTDQFNAAMDRLHRAVKPYVALGVIIADTDEEAAARLQRYMDAADVAAIDYMHRGAATDSAKGGTSDILAHMDRKGAVQMSTDFITGSPESIARQLDEWSELDIAGYMLILDDYVADIERIGTEVFPRMKNFTPSASIDQSSGN